MPSWHRTTSTFKRTQSCSSRVVAPTGMQECNTVYVKIIQHRHSQTKSMKSNRKALVTAISYSPCPSPPLGPPNPTLAWPPPRPQARLQPSHPHPRHRRPPTCSRPQTHPRHRHRPSVPSHTRPRPRQLFSMSICTLHGHRSFVFSFTPHMLLHSRVLSYCRMGHDT